MIELQSSGNNEEWPPFLLHNLPGLRKSTRSGTQKINYRELPKE